jgi:NTP pyrophosphatase (non-canonical NTP hydrolase)
MTDDTLLDRGISERSFNSVRAEDRNQIRKWGRQCVPSHKWLGYLTEEVGELAQAINKTYSDYDKEGVENVNIRNEAIQVATLALKIATMHEE